MQSLPRFNVNNNLNKEHETVGIKPPLASSTIRSKRSDNQSIDLKLGFGNLPEQMQRKAVKKGFNFTLMIVGESGLGKTTFVNTLLNRNVYGTKEELSSQELIQSTTKIEKNFVELDERGVKLRLTIVDTPGFGDGLNCDDCWQPIVEYVDETFYQFFKDECAINRKNIKDSRVHCCLYFISSINHGLKPIDVKLMKSLHHKVNIIPVIAKADSLTESELKQFKLKIKDELTNYGINYYIPPICGSDEEDEFKAQDSEIRNAIPFAVIGSNTVIDSEGGRKCRGRQYPWGVADIDNSKHCNFNILRKFILTTHMQDLKDVTSDILYENYRGEIIQVKINRRNDKCSTIASKADSTVESIDELVDTNSLLQEKDDEINSMRAKLLTMQSQLNKTSLNGNSFNGSSKSSVSNGSCKETTSNIANANTADQKSLTVPPVNNDLANDQQASTNSSIKSSSTVASAN